MSRCLVLLVLAVTAYRTSAAYNTPVQRLTDWWDGKYHYFHGYCDLPIDKKYRMRRVKVNLVIDTPSKSIQIWKLKVSKKNCDGTEYIMRNKYEIHKGVERADFILKYTSQQIPSGMCFTNLPSPTTTTAPPTPKPTTPQPTTPQPTTPQPTTSLPTSSTSQSTGNGVFQVPVVKVQEPWGEGSSWSFKGKCTFEISDTWTPATLPLDLIFNQETSNLQIWKMKVLGSSLNGMLYELTNEHRVNPGTLEITFIVDYSGTINSYPEGSCISIITPGSTQPTSTTTTYSITTDAPSRTSPAAPSTTSPAAQSTTTKIASSTATTKDESSTTGAHITTTDSSLGGTTVVPPNTAHNYGLVLEKSILFYEAQQSGDLPPSHRIKWRGDSALEDSGKNGEDLTGGWYDAGDGVKFNLPMSASVINLAVGLYKWRDAYSASNQLQHMYDSIKWPLDYFLKCWQNSTQIYYAQVGNGDTDHAIWTRPEDLTISRPPYYLENSRKGSDVAGGTAAALAAGALAFMDKDSSYSSNLLESAESLYTFAKAHQGTYNKDIPQGAEFYSSSEYRDEMCVSAALLYQATNKTGYRSDAIAFYNSYSSGRWAYDWDDKTMLCDVLLYEITKDTKYKTAVESFITSYMPGGSVHYTPCGLAWRLEWGSLRYSANAAFIALLAADTGIGDANNYKQWAMSQIHYMLGDNANDFSFVIGYGSRYPLKPHHRASSCGDPSAVCNWDDYNSPDPNPHVLQGALVGGPDQNDIYIDARDNFRTNEVACDYNAGFQSAVAGLLHFAVNGNLPAAPIPTC